jgi:hypothetical protein
MTMDAADLYAWAKVASPHESIVYHRGDVALAQPSGKFPGRKVGRNDWGRRRLVEIEEVEWCEIRDVRDEAYRLYEEGLVSLVRRRHGAFDYDYIVQRTKRKFPAQRTLKAA